MNRNLMGLVALLGAAALLGGCNDDDDDDDSGGAQTGHINVNLPTNEVTVLKQPKDIMLSGTAVYDDPTDTITLSLTLLNEAAALLQNPKLIPTNLTEGAITGDGTIGTDPYVYYGPEAMLQDASVTRDIVITGVTGAVDDVAMDVEIVTHPYFVLCSSYDEITVLDSSGTGQSAAINAEGVGFAGDPPPKEGGTSQGDTRLYPFESSADGRFVYFGCWNQPAVGRVDLSDLSVSMSDSLVALPLAFDKSGPVGYVDSLTLSPNGQHIYAVLNDGCHSIRSPQVYPAPSVQVVKLDTDLVVVDSVEVFPASVIPPAAEGGLTYVEYRGRRLSISNNGSRGALAVTGIGTVFLLDLSAMTVIDVDDVTAGTQGFDLSGTSFNVRHAAISGNGSTIYVAYNRDSDGTLDVIDVSTGAVTTEAPTTLGDGDTRAGFLEFGPDGRLYYGRNYDVLVPGVSIYDPGSDTWVELADIVNANAIEFGDDTYCVSDEDDQTIQCFSYSDDSTVTAPASGLDAVEAPVDFGHGLVRTDT